MRILVWSIWATFLSYWIIMFVWIMLRLRSNPQWKPGILDRYARSVGINFTAHSYLIAVAIAVCLTALSGLWIPPFLISILTK